MLYFSYKLQFQYNTRHLICPFLKQNILGSALKFIRYQNLWNLKKSYLIVGVVDHGGLPLALEVGVLLGWYLPLATARGRLALGVIDLRGLPLSVHVLVPG